jgi:hypothetical protein
MARRPPRKKISFRLSESADLFVQTLADECEADRSVVLRAMLAHASAHRDSVVVRVKRELETR